MSDNEWVECPHCNGKKMEFPDCEECEGRGWVDDPDGGTMSCPECDGESCSICDGEGWVAAEQNAHLTRAGDGNQADELQPPAQVA